MGMFPVLACTLLVCVFGGENALAVPVNNQNQMSPEELKEVLMVLQQSKGLSHQQLADHALQLANTMKEMDAMRAAVGLPPFKIPQVLQNLQQAASFEEPKLPTSLLKPLYPAADLKPGVDSLMPEDPQTAGSGVIRQSDLITSILNSEANANDTKNKKKTKKTKKSKKNKNRTTLSPIEELNEMPDSLKPTDDVILTGEIKKPSPAVEIPAVLNETETIPEISIETVGPVDKPAVKPAVPLPASVAAVQPAQEADAPTLEETAAAPQIPAAPAKKPTPAKKPAREVAAPQVPSAPAEKPQSIHEKNDYDSYDEAPVMAMNPAFLKPAIPVPVMLKPEFNKPNQ